MPRQHPQPAETTTPIDTDPPAAGKGADDDVVVNIHPPIDKPALEGFPDLDALRISQDFSDNLGLEKPLLRVPVGKPGSQSWIRVHHDPAYTCDTFLIEIREDREYYLVPPNSPAAILPDCKPYRLHTAITRTGVVSVWPIRLPGADGRTYPAWTLALQVAEMAKERWLRTFYNAELSGNDCIVAPSDWEEPMWPDKTFHELLKIALGGGYLIASEDHPKYRALTGR
jgi:hypothetical protein